MHQRCAGSYQTFAHTVEGLAIWLVQFLGWHTAHGRPWHRFAHPCGIAWVVFVRLDVGADEVGRHELDCVTMCTQASRPVMCPATGFHADEHWGQLRDKGHQVMPGQALAPDDLAPLIHSHHLAGPLSLPDHLTTPTLAALRARIEGIGELSPFDLLELQAYIHQRLTIAGWHKGALFNLAAVEVISRYSQGIPGAINQLCSQALLAGFAAQVPRIDAELPMSLLDFSF